MRFKTLTMWVLALSIPAFSATYYFSPAPKGNDGVSSFQAQNPATPWASIGKLNTVTLVAGDQVLFERGKEFFGRILLKAGITGTSEKYIILSSYGEGPAPIINASNVPLQSGWSHCTEARCEGLAIHSISVPNRVSQLFLDGKPMTMARFPDQGFFPISTFEGHGNNLLITSTSIVGGANWTNAAMHARISRGVLFERKVSAHDPNTGIFTIEEFGEGYRPHKGEGFFLNDHFAALSAPGEWYWDKDTKKLYFKFPFGGDPATHRVEWSAENYGLTTESGASYIRVEGLNFKYAIESAIEFTNSSFITLVGNQIDYPSKHGIKLQGKEFQVEGNRVRGAVYAGIYQDLTNGQVTDTRSRFIDNTVIGTFQENRVGTGEFRPSEVGWGLAMAIYGENNYIADNRIDSSGYIGIKFYGKNTIIERNYITRFCMYLDDAGAIYTINRDEEDRYSTEGSVIRNNIILFGQGNIHGTGNNTPFGVGIYLDERTEYVTASQNTISDAAIGIYLHDCSRNTVSENLLYKNSTSQLLLRRDAHDLEKTMEDNSITGNASFAHADGIRLYWQDEQIPNDGIMGIRSGNMWCREKISSSSCATDGETFTRFIGPSHLAARHGKDIVMNLPDLQPWTGKKRLYMLSKLRNPQGKPLAQEWEGADFMLSEAKINAWRPAVPASTRLMLLF